MIEEDYSILLKNVDIDERYLHALLLAEVVKRILKRRANIKLTNPPEIKEKPITEFMQRMRISTIEKFNNITFIGTVNFYKNSEDMKQSNVLGVIIIYIEDEFLVPLSKKLGYSLDDSEDQALLGIACGTICNLVAGNFKSGLCQLGYKEVEMSHFSSYMNNAFDGVPYPIKEKNKYEINFEIDGAKRIFADIAMGPVLKKGL